jgi:ABC-type dipeptide/oligopeptide/nickel transport system permease subunit
MRSVDVLIVFPYLVAALVIAALLEAGFGALLLALTSPGGRPTPVWPEP